MFLLTYIFIGVIFHMYVEKQIENVDMKGFVDVMFEEDDPIKDIDFNSPLTHFAMFLIDIICWPYMLYKSRNF